MECTVETIECHTRKQLSHISSTLEPLDSYSTDIEKRFPRFQITSGGKRKLCSMHHEYSLLLLDDGECSLIDWMTSYTELPTVIVPSALLVTSSIVRCRLLLTYSLIMSAFRYSRSTMKLFSCVAQSS